MDEMVQKEKKPLPAKRKLHLQDKIAKFGQLNTTFMRDITHRFSQEKELIKIRLPKK